MLLITEPPRITATRRPMLLNYACGPVAIIEIHLQERSQTHYRNVARQVTRVERHPLSDYRFLLNIPLYKLSQSRNLRIHYIFNVLSNTNLESELRSSLAPKIADFAVGFSRGLFMPFFIAAKLEISCVELVADLTELFMTLDGGDVVRNMGASRSVIEKLKKERRFDGEGDGELGTCMVCLEELSGAVELIKMPCSHLFHELCLCRWLEEKNSCPICRCEVDDDSD